MNSRTFSVRFRGYRGGSALSGIGIPFRSCVRSPYNRGLRSSRPSFVTVSFWRAYLILSVWNIVRQIQRILRWHCHPEKNEIRIIIGVCYTSISTCGNQTCVDVVVSPLRLYFGAAGCLKQIRAASFLWRHPWAGRNFLRYSYVARRLFPLQLFPPNTKVMLFLAVL